MQLICFIRLRIGRLPRSGIFIYHLSFNGWFYVEIQFSSRCFFWNKYPNNKHYIWLLNHKSLHRDCTLLRIWVVRTPVKGKSYFKISSNLTFNMNYSIDFNFTTIEHNTKYANSTKSNPNETFRQASHGLESQLWVQNPFLEHPLSASDL